VTQLYNSETGDYTEDLDDVQLWKHLDSGNYEFDEGEGGDQVPIHIVDPEKPEGLGRIHLMKKGDAKEYVLNGWGSYKNPEEVNHWLNKKEYGDREGTAAALGVAGALSLGIIPNAMALYDKEYAGIMDANPGWMIGSDILATIAALALAPASGGATLPAAGGAAGRLGLKTLLKQAKKAPFRSLTAPNIVSHLGGEMEGRVGAALLKNAAEEQLKSSAWRGLLPRAAGLGTEAFVYSMGYGLPQAIDDKLEGRSWSEVATSYGFQAGMGTFLGIAIPTAFYGTGGAALKTFQGLRKASVAPLKWTLGAATARNMAKTIADGAADMNPDTIYSKVDKKFNVIEKFTTAHLEKSASKQMNAFSAQLNKMVKKTTELMGGEFDNHELIKSIDQGGHLPSRIKKWVEHIPASRSGSADPWVMADQMLNGNFAKKDEGLSHGLIHELRRLTKTLPEAIKSSPEIEGVFNDLDIIENSILDWVRKITLKTFNPKARTGVGPGGYTTTSPVAFATNKFRAWHNMPSRSGQLQKFEEHIKKYRKHGPGMTDEQQIIVAHLAIDDWKHHGNSLINQKTGKLSKDSVDFISDTFVKLEKLSGRVHATRGAAANDIAERWADSFTRQVTEVLSNTGETWAIEGGPTAFGAASWYKSQANRMLRSRSEQHKKLVDKFHTPDVDFPDVTEVDPNRVESLLRGINHGDKEHAANMILAYARKNFELLNYLKHNYDIRGYEDAVKKAVTTTRMSKFEISKHLDLMKNKMADALEWSAIMNADNKLAMAAGNRSIMPWSIGTGAALGAGTAALGAGALPALGVGVATGASKYMYDSMANPGRAMAGINKFFTATNKFDEFITGEVNRYFMWLNRVGKAEGTSRLTYIGPGSDKYGRYPRVFTSRAIADYVTEEKEGE
tara:strand:+ start:3472 stop:6177 length:2706 start_codon:yes stop_codon:yes gene_type:complete